MKKIFIMFSSIAAVGLSHVSTAAEIKPIEVEVRYAPSPYPSACKELAELAAANFSANWVNGLDDPVPSVQIDADREAEVMKQDKEKGSVRLGRYLAPKGSHAVILDQKNNFSGTSASLFVDCQKRLAFVSVRGGFQDELRWFGPYAL